MRKVMFEILKCLNDKNYDYIYEKFIKTYDIYDIMKGTLELIKDSIENKKDINILNNLSDLLYMLYKDKDFNFDMLSRGDLFYLGKLNKVYNDYIQEQNSEIKEEVIAKINEISSEVKKKYNIEENCIYIFSYKVEKMDSRLDNILSQINKLLKSSQKNKNEKLDFYQKKEKMDEINLSLHCINKGILHLQSEVLKKGSDSQLLSDLKKLVSKLIEAQESFKSLILVNPFQNTDLPKNNFKEDYLPKEILNLLSNGSYSLEEIRNYLLNKGFIIDSENLYKVLTTLNNEIKIMDESDLSVSSIYKICEPTYEEGKKFKFSLDNKTNELDVLFISDLHIYYDNDDKVFDVLNRLYDYCNNQKIKTIVNLGDLCSISSYKLSMQDALNEVEVIVSKIIEEFPKDSNIVHLLMGGNHDMGFFYAGIDPIKLICHNRMDFKNLGYNQAMIEIGQKENTILLHHPDLRVGDNLDLVRQLVKQYNDEANISSDNILMDFFGHFHKSMLDLKNHCCFIPSLLKDRYMNGAWHIKFYFDNYGKVSDMMFMPIINIDNKFVKTNELIYQRKLKKM